MKKDQNLMAMDAQRMTSLEIAAVTGKPHGDVLKAIRKMEKASCMWLRSLTMLPVQDWY